jgi:hypothetical protein
METMLTFYIVLVLRSLATAYLLSLPNPLVCRDRRGSRRKSNFGIP